VRVEFSTYLVERSRRWVEYIGMSFPDVDGAGAGDGVLLQTYTTEVAPGQDVIVAGDRAVADDYQPELRNTWPLSRNVGRISGTPVVSSVALDDDSFWQLIHASHKASNPWDRARLIRESLQEHGREVALAYQYALVAKSVFLVRELGLSWDSAGFVVMAGLPYYTQVLSGERIAPQVRGEPEFEDDADVAEEAIGHPIYIEGFGTSRSMKRDPMPVVASDWLDSSLLRNQSLGIAEWDGRPQRWVTFRLAAASEEGIREAHVFVNRQHGIGYAQAAQLAVNATVREGETLASGIECVDPRLVGMLRGMSPISYFRARGLMSAREFTRLRGYAER